MSLREFTPKGTSVAAETYPSDEPEEYGDDVNLNAEPGAAELAEIERSGLEAEPGTYSFDSGTPETNRGEKDAFDNNDVLPLGERIARAQYDRAAQMNHLRAYKDTIGKIALLSASQEVELAKRIEAGLYASQQLQEARRTDAELPDKLRRDLTLIAEEGKVAKDRYILANLRLVVSVAQHYEYRAMSMGLMDLIQVGNMGLIRAVEGFDYQRGFKFSTYAIWCIRSVISGALAKEARLIHIPQYKVEEILNAANKDRDLRVALVGSPRLLSWRQS